MTKQQQIQRLKDKLSQLWDDYGQAEKEKNDAEQAFDEAKDELNRIDNLIDEVQNELDHLESMDAELDKFYNDEYEENPKQLKLF